jgi:uncharacterized protein (TIGR03437 family)
MRVLYLAALATAAFAQVPSIRATDGVLNGASYALSGLPNAGIAQGSIFVIFGDNLGPATLAQVNAFPLPTTAGLAGTSVAVTVGGTTVNAIMIYTVKTQVAAVLPSNTPTGTGTVRVTFNGQSSNAAPIRVVARSFGIFSLNQAGGGPAIVQNVNSENDRPINAFNRPARPGQVMILWGTGIGAVAGNEAGSALPGDMTGVNLKVFAGAREAAVQYRGRSGCCVGIDQIVFTVPDGVEGCYVPISVVVDGVVSNYGSMAISRTTASCVGVPGYTDSQWQSAITSANFRTAFLTVQRIFNRNFGAPSGTAPYRTDYISALYSAYNAPPFLTAPGPPPVGACVVAAFPSAVALPAPLDAGAVSVSGPVGTRALSRQSTGFYQTTFFPAAPGGATGGGLVIDGTLVTAGGYTFSALAGLAVGAHTASINHPATFAWNEFSAFPATVDRTQPLTITWSGGTPGALVNIHGTSAYGAGPQGDTGAWFQCIADGGDGRFTIPASVLSSLPPTYSLPAGGGPHGSIDVSQYIYAVPPPNVPGIDYASMSAGDFHIIYGVSYR